MKDRRDFIINKAMELYAISGYNNVSITDLQIALDMGRGTLYYYFKDQDELFKTCMERFFLGPKQHAFENLPENPLVEDMIQAMLGYIGSLETALMTFDNKNVNTSNVVNLMCSAYAKFPSLYAKANRIYRTESDLWQKAIRNSIRAGVVRSDIDIELMAMMFTHLKDAYDSARSGEMIDFSMFDRVYYGLYDLIKVKP